MKLPSYPSFRQTHPPPWQYEGVQPPGETKTGHHLHLQHAGHPHLPRTPPPSRASRKMRRASRKAPASRSTGTRSTSSWPTADARLSQKFGVWGLGGLGSASLPLVRELRKSQPLCCEGSKPCKDPHERSRHSPSHAEVRRSNPQKRPLVYELRSNCAVVWSRIGGLELEEGNYPVALYLRLTSPRPIKDPNRQ